METELHPGHDADLLTLDELTERTGVSARNVRFYASRGLVPSPVRRGRSGYYGPDHVARLELVRELQGHGFTLSAIEKYVERIPATATPSDIARHLSLSVKTISTYRTRILDKLRLTTTADIIRYALKNDLAE